MSVATAPSDRLLDDLVFNGANMSLYLVVMRGWLSFGVSEWWIRLPSVIFAAASIPIFFRLAQRFVSGRAALIGSGLLTVSPPIALHSKNARSYTLTMLLVLGAWLAAVRFVEKPSSARRRWYVALAALAIYAHIIAGLVIAAQLAWMALSSRRGAIHAGVRVCLLVAPQYLLALHPAAHRPEWIPKMDAHQLIDAAHFITGTDSTLAAGVVIVLWLVGGVVAVRRYQTRLPVIWVLFPVAGLLTVSFVMPLLVPRYLLIIAPGGILLLTVVIDAVPRVGPAIACALLVVTLPQVPSRAWPERSDWQEIARVVFDNAEAGELILFPTTRANLEYYWDVEGRPAVPASLSPPKAWGAPRRTYPAIDLADARERAAGATGIWVVERSSQGRTSLDLPRLLGDRYERQGWHAQREWQSAGRVRVVYYVRRTGT